MKVVFLCQKKDKKLELARLNPCFLTAPIRDAKFCFYRLKERFWGIAKKLTLQTKTGTNKGYQATQAV